MFLVIFYRKFSNWVCFPNGMFTCICTQSNSSAAQQHTHVPAVQRCRGVPERGAGVFNRHHGGDQSNAGGEANVARDKDRLKAIERPAAAGPRSGPSPPSPASTDRASSSARPTAKPIFQCRHPPHREGPTVTPAVPCPHNRAAHAAQRVRVAS